MQCQSQVNVELVRLSGVIDWTLIIAQSDTAAAADRYLAITRNSSRAQLLSRAPGDDLQIGSA